MAKFTVELKNNTLKVYCNGEKFYTLIIEKGALIKENKLNEIVKNAAECLSNPEAAKKTIYTIIKDLLRSYGLYDNDLKTLVLIRKNDVNGNARYTVKFNYMTEIDKAFFRSVKAGFNFSTPETIKQYLSQHVERFDESDLIVVKKEKDFKF